MRLQHSIELYLAMRDSSNWRQSHLAKITTSLKQDASL